jgi:hypothetical protein
MANTTMRILLMKFCKLYYGLILIPLLGRIKKNRQLAGLLTCSLKQWNGLPGKYQWHFVPSKKGYLQQRDCSGIAPDSLLIIGR